jgi:MFS family permease
MPFRLPRGLPLICLCTAAWAFNFGLFSQLTTFWLNDLGQGDGVVNTEIGLNQGCYYFGLAAVVMLVPRMMRRWGLRCTVVGLTLSGLCTILFPYAGTLAGWYGLRILSGAAAALTLIPLETYISQEGRPEHRSRNFGWYAVALTVGGGLGLGLGPDLFVAGSPLPFWMPGALAILGGVLFLRYRLVLPTASEEVDSPRPADLGRQVLSYGTAWAQGFLEGGLLAFLSLYLLSLGLSKESTGAMVGASMVGILLFQVPVSWLGDRLGRTPVLLVCYGVVAAGLVALPRCEPGLWLVVWLFLLGGCSGSFYPLGIALLGGSDCETRLARAYAWYMILEAVGSQLGPLLMGRARDVWGERAMFAVGQAALLAVLLLWLSVHFLNRRRLAAATSVLPRTRDAA